ncbi:hypothetical protein HU200_054163 [Digitaria exilis]|uniref:Protein FAR1-RELATED SEQUENCE n=1 Tax=Digitaria exilis TaxID=1010633 RepID=A0A835E781_9POAL|nr:hypothetical protein HU200_054163 [Digitaria exilis]
MVITLVKGSWTVTRLNLDHNHVLLPTELTKLLRSHRFFSDDEKAIIRSLVKVNVPNRKILAFLSSLRGGEEFSSVVETDISNYRTKIQRETGCNDMTLVVQFLKDKQAQDPLFFFSFDADEQNKVRNIFWSYGKSRVAYEHYGDVVSFDTTYETNRYKLRFAPFVGINGHGDNLLFAGALLSDETIPTFRWLFRTFRSCMGGKAPKSIITDQDAAMRGAIELEFPETIHRNCLFHIVSKAEMYCGPAFNKIPDFGRDFYDIIYNSLTTQEFETLWKHMVEKHKVYNLRFLQIMFDNRARFVPVYFKDNFFPFICSTSRSEGMNAIFKDNIGPTSSVLLLLQEFDTQIKNIDERGNLKDKNKAHSMARLHSRYNFERQARDLYNTQIFFRFQQIVKAIGMYQIEEHQKDKAYMVFKSEEHAVNEIRPRKYLVLVNLQQENYICICARFQKDGLLCAHILRTLVQLNRYTLAEKYFIDRWRPVEKTNIRDASTKVPHNLRGGSNMLRHNLLSRKFVEVVSDGCLNLDRCNHMLKGLDKLHDEIKKIPVRNQSRSNNDVAEEDYNAEQNSASHGETAKNERQQLNGDGNNTSELASTQNTDHSSVIQLDSLKNPDLVQAKGRPRTKVGNSKRWKPIAEIVRTKNR